MSVLDDILARVGIGGSQPAGMLDLKPQMDMTIDPVTGRPVPKASFKNLLSGQPTGFDKVRGTPEQEAAALPKMAASAGIAAPNAPFSAGDGAAIPFTPQPPPQQAPMAGPVPMPQPRPDAADAPPAAPVALTPADPGDSQLPSKSAPAQGEAPSAEPSILDKLLTGLGNNSSTLVALGAGLAGAPNAGQGISRALTAALPAQQADLKRTMALGSQQATFKSLVDAGVPRQQAISAVQPGNAKLLEALTSRYLVDPKFETKTVTDMLGNQHLIAVNPYTLKSKEVTGNDPGSDAEDAGTTPAATPGGPGNNPATLRTSLNAAAAVPQSYDPETHRDETFLKTLDPLTASAVKDIADGKMPATGRNMQKLMPLVSRYENGFDNTTYQRRQALEKSYYGGGEGAKALRSANTVIDHGIDLKKSIDDLHNFSVLPDIMNKATGTIAAQYSKPYQDALRRFGVNSEVFARELDFALTGKSTVSGQREIRGMFDPYGSPVSNQAALQKAMEMLDRRVSEHQNTYETGMNKRGGAMPDMLTKRRELNALLGADTGAGVNADGPVAPSVPSAPTIPKLGIGESHTIGDVTIKRLGD